MKVISHEDIVKLNIPPEECYKWVEEAIKAKEKAILPPKISMKPYPGVFCNVMPSILDTSYSKYGGIKIVTRYPERKPSLESKVLLYDITNGDLLAIMNADWITAMRTGAVAAHSVMT